MNIMISNQNKIRKGTRFYLSDTPKNQADKKDEIEKVPSLPQKGTQSLRKYVITEKGIAFLSGRFVTDKIKYLNADW